MGQLTRVVLVSGSRALNDRRMVFKNLDRIHAEGHIDCILHGSCPNRKDHRTHEIIWSADMLANAWAQAREVAYLGIPAKWTTGSVGGPAEGPIRNQLMADIGPHYAVIFPGGCGTNDMLDKVIAAKIPYEVISGT